MESVSYWCVKCARKFKDRAECEESEKRCGTPFPVKCIKTNLFFDDKGKSDDVEVFEYPDAVWRCGDMIELFQSSYIRGLTAELDNVIYDKDGGRFYVYTSKFDDESERKYIKMLLECREVELKKYLERVKGQIGYNETLINDSCYRIGRVKNARVVMSDDDVI